VVGDGPAGSDADEEHREGDVCDAHEELTDSTQSISTCSIGPVAGPVAHDKEEGESNEGDDACEDIDDDVSRVVAAKEHDRKDLKTSEDEEEDKVDCIEGEHALFIKA